METITASVVSFWRLTVLSFTICIAEAKVTTLVLITDMFQGRGDSIGSVKRPVYLSVHCREAHTVRHDSSDNDGREELQFA